MFEYLWDSDLDSEAKTMLSGYVSQDASKSIYIREVDSSDPWTMRFLIIAAKASTKNLETFKEMDILYNSTTQGEKLLSHSYLLEQGILGFFSTISIFGSLAFCGFILATNS